MEAELDMVRSILQTLQVKQPHPTYQHAKKKHSTGKLQQGTWLPRKNKTKKTHKKTSRGIHRHTGGSEVADAGRFFSSFFSSFCFWRVCCHPVVHLPSGWPPSPRLSCHGRSVPSHQTWVCAQSPPPRGKYFFYRGLCTWISGRHINPGIAVGVRPESQSALSHVLNSEANRFLLGSRKPTLGLPFELARFERTFLLASLNPKAATQGCSQLPTSLERPCHRNGVPKMDIDFHTPAQRSAESSISRFGPCLPPRGFGGPQGKFFC